MVPEREYGEAIAAFAAHMDEVITWIVERTGINVKRFAKTVHLSQVSNL